MINSLCTIKGIRLVFLEIPSMAENYSESHQAC